MLGRVKLDNTRLTCDQGNFNHITARSRNRIQFTEVSDACDTTVPPTPHRIKLTFVFNAYQEDCKARAVGHLLRLPLPQEKRVLTGF